MSPDSVTPQDFPLGGDLPINRIGFDAMRLSANGFTAPGPTTPKPVTSSCASCTGDDGT
jgi:hypothetical protein